MVVVQVESPALELKKLAREAMAECGHDRLHAAALMKRWLVDDPTLRERLSELFEDDGIASAVAGVDSDNRRTLRLMAIRSAPDHPSQRRQPTQNKATPEMLMAVQDRHDADPTLDFHQWALPGGQPLGTATPADVLLAIRFYGENERTFRVSRRFLELVHERMQGGSCVAKVLSHAVLQRLMRQAEDEV